MELTYQLNKNINRVLCLDNVSSVQSGADIDISDALCCMLIVEGEFEGRVKPILKADDMKLETMYPTCRDAYGNYVPYITAPGVYYVNNIDGYSTCVPRLDTYTSGAVTVVGVSIAEGLRIPQDRNVILKRFNVTVAAGEDYGTEGVYLTGYPFHYLTVVADSEHQFEVTADYRASGSIQGYPIKGLSLFASNGSKSGYCEWQEAKGEIIAPKIINSDEESHTYELIVYGVR